MQLEYAEGDKLYCRSSTSSAYRNMSAAVMPHRSYSGSEGPSGIGEAQGLESVEGRARFCSTSIKRHLVEGHGLSEDGPWQHPSSSSRPLRRASEPGPRAGEIKVDMETRAPWIDCSAASVGFAIPRSRCAPLSRPSWTASRWAVLVPTTVLAQQHYLTSRPLPTVPGQGRHAVALSLRRGGAPTSCAA